MARFLLRAISPTSQRSPACNSKIGPKRIIGGADSRRRFMQRHYRSPPSQITRLTEQGEGARMISKAKPFVLTICLTVLMGMLPAAIETLAQQTVQSRTVRPAGVSGELLDILNANDGKTDTRATSGKIDYVGMSVTIDAGGLQNIIGVKQ